MKTTLDIARQRLFNQYIATLSQGRPEELVSWLGAVQAQDYAGGKWALGLRSHGITEKALDHAFAEGKFIRTHVMRPTWHFVAPEDLRWMLALTAPRVKALLAYYDRQHQVDAAEIEKSNSVLTHALENGQQLARPELGAVLQEAGIATDNGQRLAHLLMHAELEAVICSGGRRGKQFTYALIEERIPKTKPLDREEALAELTKRYFVSHGPATIADFVWWSGLTMADAKLGLELSAAHLNHEIIEGSDYWFAASMLPAKDLSGQVYLLPNYDEYIVAYADRSASVDSVRAKAQNPRDSIIFNHAIVIDGRVVGTWRRTFKKKEVLITPIPFREMSTSEINAFAVAAKQYGEFLGLSAVVTDQAELAEAQGDSGVAAEEPGVGADL